MTTKITEQNISNLANLGVQWQSIHVADGSTALTVSPGKGYFIDTTSAAQTVNLPANTSSTAGDTIVLKDYARNWGTNSVTISSNTFDGDVVSNTFNTDGQTVTLVHMGTTKGWSLINEDTTSSLGSEYITATGGTITTSGDFKVHSFTGDGCFVVSVGNGPLATVDYLVIGGGAGGGGNTEPGAGGGGGGAGGFRVSNSYSLPGPTTSPLASPTGVPTPVGTYPITVGGGGSGGGPQQAANPGSNSVFSTITSAGGGRGGSNGPGIPSPNNGAARDAGASGGSGGGGGHGGNAGGTGNTPPVSPPQGNDGGDGGPTQPSFSGAGGGGAGAAGQDVQGCSPNSAGTGGIGSFVSPSLAVGCAGTPGPVGSTRYFGGGGGGASQPNPSGPRPGGSGGGGTGGVGNPAPGTGGSANTGGGGGGGGGNQAATGGSGGKGIVILRYKFQN